MQSHTRYMLITVFSPLAFLLFCFLLPMTHYHAKISNYYWDPIVEQRFLEAGEKKDVVFVGDSSTVHGIRPVDVEKVSGLSGQNLGMPVDSLVFTPFLALDHYLANNAAPRLIVLNITPWTANVTLATKGCDVGTPWYSSAVTVLRYGNFQEFKKFFLKCPEKLFHFPMVIAKQVASFDPRALSYVNLMKFMNSEAGYVPFDRNNPQSLSDRTCSPYLPLEPTFTSFVREFKQRYDTATTKALLYLNPAPVPLCDLNELKKSFEGIADNVPYGLDNRYFVNLRHLGDEGALANSKVVGEFLKKYR